MLTFGALRSHDGQWKAELFVRTNGTYGFRVLRYDAHEQAWVPPQGMSDSVLSSEGDAIAEAAARFPQLDPQTFAHYKTPAEVEGSAGNRRRGIQAGLGALGLLSGIVLLYLGAMGSGIIVLTVGCLGLGWAMGGHGGSGYGASDS